MAGLSARQALTPCRVVWWSVWRNYTVLSLSVNAKTTKFNICLWFWSRLTCPIQNFRSLQFLMWPHHDIALWRHGVMLDTMPFYWRQLLTSTAELALLTTWLDCGKLVIRNISNAVSRYRAVQSRGNIPDVAFRHVLGTWLTTILLNFLTQFLCPSVISNHLIWSIWCH